MTCSLCVAFMSSDFTYLAVMAMAATFHCSLTCWPLSHSGHASKVTLIEVRLSCSRRSRTPSFPKHRDLSLYVSWAPPSGRGTIGWGCLFFIFACGNKVFFSPFLSFFNMPSLRFLVKMFRSPLACSHCMCKLSQHLTFRKSFLSFIWIPFTFTIVGGFPLSLPQTKKFYKL